MYLEHSQQIRESLRMNNSIENITKQQHIIQILIKSKYRVYTPFFCAEIAS